LKRAAHAVGCVLLVVAAVVLWPRQWGGAMTYVVTTGSSMEPRFSAGDVVMLREAERYTVGDVAAYRSTELNTVVLHRITSEQGGRFTFQGDTNGFVDPDSVTEQQILGTPLVHVPKLGLVLGWLVKPVNLLTLVFALFLLLSDRTKKNAGPGWQRVVAVSDVSFPPEVTAVDVTTEDDLLRLAEHFDRPVLRDDAAQELYVVGGTVVYHCSVTTGPANADALSPAVPHLDERRVA
jgi:signal peptidase I